MGSHKKELKNLLREYDLLQDEEMVEFAIEVFELGCEAGEMKGRNGFGFREEFDDEDGDFDEDEERLFRRVWSEGGYGARGSQGGGSSSGGGRYSGGGYGNRRGVKGTGRYSRYRR